MFFALAESASLVDIAISTGLEFLRCDLHAIVTGVSVIPRLSLASVFAVQGATTIMSNIFLGPIGSASSMVRIALRLQILSSQSTLSAAFPNRVFIDEELKDIIGVTSQPICTSCEAQANAFSNVQNEPHTQKPTLNPSNILSLFIAKARRPFHLVCLVLCLQLFFPMLQVQPSPED